MSGNKEPLGFKKQDKLNNTYTKIKQFFRYVLNSKLFSVIMLPYVLYTTIYTGYKYYYQSRLLKRCISTNPTFFMMLEDNGFTLVDTWKAPSFGGAMLFTEYIIQEGEYAPDIINLTKRNLSILIDSMFPKLGLIGQISLVSYRSQDESVLGHILKPSFYDPYANNMTDLLISLALYTTIFLSYFWLI